MIFSQVSSQVARDIEKRPRTLDPGQRTKEQG